eukprot:TRINITY_DN1153_c0_g1_i1.p1 TRINITY_DN1153_c0_g1~~TRINITY_DN1153_c0_g1_i1.p1  ORF type:complete len:378 (-),score=57.65 TRINITY_DN1153_c0_g1_i1:296-1429(-)
MASRYCLVSLPLHESANETWATLQQTISKIAFDTPTYRLQIPDLRVGTLDSLLALSDDLQKVSSTVEGVTHKIRRQIEEFERLGSEAESSALTVDGTPIDTYITRFTWDEAKYPVVSPLRETVDSIQDSVSKIEDDLKVRVAEFSNVKSQLSSINRKQGGSLLVRDLAPHIRADDVIHSEHLTTPLVIVPKYSQKEWIASYETLSTFVVPRSSKKLLEENDYSLYTVTLFRKVADTFKLAAREKGFQVREYEHDPEGQQKQIEELEHLTRDQENVRRTLQRWCYDSYGEVFSSWMHLSAVRLFAESILRYGLPPKFLAAVIAPTPKVEKKLRAVLDKLAGTANSSFWRGDSEAGLLGLTGGDAEVHPYVSITMNLAG